MVDLPWSMCAMMEKFLICCVGTCAQIRHVGITIDGAPEPIVESYSNSVQEENITTMRHLGDFAVAIFCLCIELFWSCHSSCCKAPPTFAPVPLWRLLAGLR